MADLRYEVTFKGVASDTLRSAFVGHDLGVGAGVTLVRCRQDALCTVMARIEELGLELLDVRLLADRSATIEPAPDDGPTSRRHHSGEEPAAR